MDFKEENFPVYQALVKYESDNIGVKNAIEGFNAAVKGGYKERFDFAFGIQTVVVNMPVGEIKGTDQEGYDKTLRSCFEIFEEAASHGHELAALMVDDFRARGLGQPLPEPAPQPVRKAPSPKSQNFDF